MHPYILHLLNDIQAAHRSETGEKPRIVSFEEQMEEAERFVTRPFGKGTLSDHCGLNREIFPPVEQLSEEDMRLVNEQFINMLRSWHAEIGLPTEMPTAMQYQLLVDLLDHDFMYFEYGFYGIDFCTGNPEGCKLGAYCPCLEHESI